MLEKTLDSPLDCKKILVHPKGNQSWIFIGRTDAEAEAPILWPLDVKNWLIWKDPDTGKDWGQEEKGMTEDEMVGWHHGLDGRESEWTPGVGDGRETWRAAIDGVAKSRTRLSDWTELNQHRRSIHYCFLTLIPSFPLNYFFLSLKIYINNFNEGLWVIYAFKLCVPKHFLR